MPFTIKKIGHSCVTYERDGVKIMMDPGDWSSDPWKEEGVKHIFISHKHPDHCSIPAIKAVLGKNPVAKVWTNEDVGTELTKHSVPWEKFEGGDILHVSESEHVFSQAVHENDPSVSPSPGSGSTAPLGKGSTPMMKIEGIGKLHAHIHPEVPDISNTGLLIDGKFFHPGDSYLLPEKPVEVLALPLFSPWNTIAMTIAFARGVAPKYCFPIHDGMLRSEAERLKGIPTEFLAKNNIEYRVLQDGERWTFEG